MFILANVVDDIEMHISHVIRAEEHLPNTPKQQLLWEAVGHRPPVWAHVPVVVNEQRKKLSKRRDKVALEGYRDEGYLAEAMVNYLMTLGWAPKGDTEIVPWATIERDFRLEDVTHSPAFFDIKKLTAFNGEYIRTLGAAEFVDACAPFVHSSTVPWPAERFDPDVFAAIAPLLQTRVGTLGEVPAMIDFLFLESPVIDEAAVAKALRGPGRDVLVAATTAYGELPIWDATSLKETLEAIGVELDVKKGKATDWPVRVAVTGRLSGPPLFESLELLGREATLRRMATLVEATPA